MITQPIRPENPVTPQAPSVSRQVASPSSEAPVTRLSGIANVISIVVLADEGVSAGDNHGGPGHAGRPVPMPPRGSGRWHRALEATLPYGQVSLALGKLALYMLAARKNPKQGKWTKGTSDSDLDLDTLRRELSRGASSSDAQTDSGPRIAKNRRPASHAFTEEAGDIEAMALSESQQRRREVGARLRSLDVSPWKYYLRLLKLRQRAVDFLDALESETDSATSGWPRPLQQEIDEYLRDNPGVHIRELMDDPRLVYADGLKPPFRVNREVMEAFQKLQGLVPTVVAELDEHRDSKFTATELYRRVTGQDPDAQTVRLFALALDSSRLVGKIARVHTGATVRRFYGAARPRRDAADQ